MKLKSFLTLLVLCAIWSASLGQQIIKQDLAKVEATVEAIVLQPLAFHESYVLTISGQGVFKTVLFDGKDTPFIDLFGNDDWLPEGAYTWELTAKPVVNEASRSAMQWARETGDYSALNNLRKNGQAPNRVESQSGSFRVLDGQFVVPSNDLQEEPYVASKGSDDGRPDGVEPGRVDPRPDNGGTVDSGSNDSDDDNRDQQINDDLIVFQSLCVGQDCVNGEAFGFDTIRLKENNLRIRFFDTSNSGSFPTRDWQLTANDSSNGGQDKFSIDDIDSGRTPFTIEASAPSHSLYVDDGGRIGLGKSTPAVELHMVDGDTPTIRLEQDGSSGFTAQTWDVAGNEAGFFVRDVTNGSELAFRIEPGADEGTLFLDSGNRVGIGTTGPDAKLHVRGTDGATKVRVQEASGTTADRILMLLENNGGSVIRMENTGAGTAWLIANTGSAFRLIGPDARFTMTDAGRVTMGSSSATSNFDLDATTGNLILQGMLTHTSDRNSKQDIVPVDRETVLNKVVDLEIAEWTYIDTPGVRHMGPMAQDFYAAFGLGFSDTTLSSSDLSAAAIASVQALNQQLSEEVEAKDAQIKSLEERLARIEKALEQNSDLNP